MKSDVKFIHYLLTFVLLAFILYHLILIFLFGSVEISESRPLALALEIAVCFYLVCFFLFLVVKTFRRIMLSSKKSLRHTDNNRIKSPQGSQAENQHKDPLHDLQATGKEPEIKHYQ